MERPDLAGNSKILESHLDPNLKELEALRWTRGHQDFLGQRSGTTMEKTHPWELKYLRSGPIRTNGGKTYAFLSGGISWAKTFIPGAWGQGSGAKKRRGRLVRSAWTLNGRAIKSIVWGPKAVSDWCQAARLREQSRSDRLREGASAGLSLEGTYMRFKDKFRDIVKEKISFKMSDIAEDFETCLSQRYNRDLLSTKASILALWVLDNRLSRVLKRALASFTTMGRQRVASSQSPRDSNGGWPGRLRHPPQPENEESECRVRWMYRSLFQGRKPSHESRNLQWRSSWRRSGEKRNWVLANLAPREMFW